MLLVITSLAAGTINTVAGGGLFRTVGAFVAAGFPPLVANVSSAVALTPANLVSVAGYGPEMRQSWPRYR